MTAGAARPIYAARAATAFCTASPPISAATPIFLPIGTGEGMVLT
jgi:hypothetical protein